MNLVLFKGVFLVKKRFSITLLLVWDQTLGFWGGLRAWRTASVVHCFLGWGLCAVEDHQPVAAHLFFFYQPISFKIIFNLLFLFIPFISD